MKMTRKIRRTLGLAMAALLVLPMAGCTEPPAQTGGPTAQAVFAVVDSSVREVTSAKNSFTTTLTVAGGATLAPDLGPGAVVLSDGFATMDVTSLERIDDTTLAIAVAGDFALEPGGLPYTYGTVGLTPGAVTGAGDPSPGRIMITHPTMAVIGEAMRYDAGVMDIYLGLHGAEFADALTPDMFTVVSGGTAVPVVAVERTATIEARLSLALSATGLDEAIERLRGGTVSALAGAFTDGAPLTGPTTITTAHLTGHITSVTHGDQTTRVAAALTVVRGYLGDLTPAALSFAGDFQGARDVEVSPTELGAVVSFGIPQRGTSEETVLLGTVAVADGVLKNLWGSDAADAGVVLRWASGHESKGVVDSAMSFWGAYGGTIGTVGNVASSAASIFNAGKSVLEMFGVVEGTNAKIDKVYKEMNAQFAATHQKLNAMQADISSVLKQSQEIKEQLTAVHEQLLTMGQQLGDLHDEMIRSQEQAAFLARNREVEAAAGQWSIFYRNVQKLESLTASFRNLTLTELFNIVKNPTVTVHWDSEGTVAVKNPMSPRANTGFYLASSATYELPAAFVSQVKAAGEVPEYGLNTLATLLAGKYEAPVVQDIINSISLQAVYGTASLAKFNDYTTVFFEVAQALGGTMLGTDSPLYHHDIAVEAAFNWEPSTHAAKNLVRLYILTVLADAAMTGKGYVATIQSNSAKEIAAINQALDKAAEILVTNTGIRPAPASPFVFSTHARQPVLIVVAQVKPSYGWPMPEPYGVSWGQPWLRVSTDLNRVYLPHRPDVTLTTAAASQAVLPELFTRPVLSTLQIELMAASARLRNTTYAQEIEAVKLGPQTGGWGYTYPGTPELHTRIRLVANGPNLGLKGEFVDAAGVTRTYTREVLSVRGDQATLVAPVTWAFFSATAPAWS